MYKKRVIQQILFYTIAFILIACTEDEPSWNNPFYPVEGPAMLLNPQEIHLPVNTSFSISLRLEDVKDVMGIYAEIKYNTSVLSFVGFKVLDSKGSLLKSTGGEVLSFIESDSKPDVIVANIGIAVGTPRCIKGSGNILRLDFHIHKSQKTEISLSNACRLTDSNLNDVPIYQLINGKIYVE